MFCFCMFVFFGRWKPGTDPVQLHAVVKAALRRRRRSEGRAGRRGFKHWSRVHIVDCSHNDAEEDVTFRTPRGIMWSIFEKAADGVRLLFSWRCDAVGLWDVAAVLLARGAFKQYVTHVPRWPSTAFYLRFQLVRKKVQIKFLWVEVTKNDGNRLFFVKV